MITNPKLGMQVRISLVGSDWNGAIGIIDYIHHDRLNRIDYVGVQFGRPIIYSYFWLSNLNPLDLSPEEQDQERRQAHADKYL